MELYTFDMDIGALWGEGGDVGDKMARESLSNFTLRQRYNSADNERKSIIRTMFAPNQTEDDTKSDNKGDTTSAFTLSSLLDDSEEVQMNLPTGPVPYSLKQYAEGDMKKIRERFNETFFKTFRQALTSYYNREWNDAKMYFQTILTDFNDGPSRHFLMEIEKNGGVPPKTLTWYSR